MSVLCCRLIARRSGGPVWWRSLKVPLYPTSHGLSLFSSAQNKELRRSFRKHGTALLAIDCITWGSGVAIIFGLIYGGINPDWILARINQVYDRIGWPPIKHKEATTNAAILSASYAMSFAFTPLRLLLDVYILRKLKKRGFLATKR